MQAVIEFFSLFSTLPNNRKGSSRGTLRVLRSELVTFFKCLLLHFASQSCKMQYRSYSFQAKIHNTINSEIYNSFDFQLFFKKNKQTQIPGIKAGFTRVQWNSESSSTFFDLLLHVIFTCFLYVAHLEGFLFSVSG